MSRSGYNDGDGDQWGMICWRGAVKSALRGKRGQEFLKELAVAMDAMPVKRLVAEELQADGEFCTLGVVGHARGMDMGKIDPDDSEFVAEQFGIAESMTREIVWENDEHPGIYDQVSGWRRETPEERWKRMRNWVDSQIVQVAP
ncbi:hypothetical protein GIV19_16790 [Pseudomonas syringae]|uniref:hypothetical protein n=1 Tax=Pseudomonas syringae TaxID=317 RepID=UPI001F1B7C98|nr:hypothetical protein [Pseudomonas syringae]MCF5708940.1 hypothetical protein [Pseudomonas syringae]